MLWPEFDALGDLPIGVHRASITEIIGRFGSGTAQRLAVTARLETDL